MQEGRRLLPALLHLTQGHAFRARLTSLLLKASIALTDTTPMGFAHSTHFVAVCCFERDGAFFTYLSNQVIIS
jgi:hypothetical protein